MGSSMVISWEMLGDELFFFFHGGYRNSWLVYNGKSHLEMDDDWGYHGVPLFLGDPPYV